eukprot:g4475.t1
MDDVIDLTNTTPELRISELNSNEDLICLLTPEGSPVRQESHIPPVIEIKIPALQSRKDDATIPVENTTKRTASSGLVEIHVELSQELIQDVMGSILMTKMQTSGPNGLPHSISSTIGQKPRCFVVWQQWSRGSKKQEMKFHHRFPYVLYIFKAAEFINELLSDGLESFIIDGRSLWPSSSLAMMVIDSHQELGSKKLKQKIMNVLLKFRGLSFHSIPDMSQAADHVLYLTEMFGKPPPYKEENKFLSIFGGCKNSVALSDIDLKLTMQSRLSPELKNWINLLHTIPGVGPGDAHAIAAQYSSFGALMEAFMDPVKSSEEKLARVANLTLSSASGARVGEAAAKTLFNFLLSIDANIFL